MRDFETECLMVVYSHPWSVILVPVESMSICSFLLLTRIHSLPLLHKPLRRVYLWQAGVQLVGIIWAPLKSLDLPKMQKAWHTYVEIEKPDLNLAADSTS